MVERVMYPGELDPNFTIISGSGVEKDPWKGIYLGYYPNLNGVSTLPFLESPVNDERVYRLTLMHLRYAGAAAATVTPYTWNNVVFRGTTQAFLSWPPYTTTGDIMSDSHVWDDPHVFVAKGDVKGGPTVGWTTTSTPVTLKVIGAGLNDDVALYIEADIWRAQPHDTTPAGMTPVSVEGYRWPLRKVL